MACLRVLLNGAVLEQKLPLRDEKRFGLTVPPREKARFLPDGITAANQLGLTDAVPAKATVHADARLRSIHFDRLVIDFKPTAPGICSIGRPAMHIVQALHWLPCLLPSIRECAVLKMDWRVAERVDELFQRVIIQLIRRRNSHCVALPARTSSTPIRMPSAVPLRIQKTGWRSCCNRRVKRTEAHHYAGPAELAEYYGYQPPRLPPSSPCQNPDF